MPVCRCAYENKLKKEYDERMQRFLEAQDKGESQILHQQVPLDYIFVGSPVTPP